MVDGSVKAKDGHPLPPSEVQGQPRAHGTVQETQRGHQEGGRGGAVAVGGGGGEEDGGVGEGDGVDGRVGAFENGHGGRVSAGGIAQVANRHHLSVNGLRGNGWSPQMTAAAAAAAAREGGGGGGGGAAAAAAAEGAHASQIVIPSTGGGGDFGQAYYSAFGLDGADAAVGECA